MNFITQDIYEAAYAKSKGFQIGLVQKSKGSDYATIEIIGDIEGIRACIESYYNGADTNARLLFKELGYIKYLVKRA